MDGYEHLDLDEIDFAPVEHDTERLLSLLTPEATQTCSERCAPEPAVGPVSARTAPLPPLSEHVVEASG
ncbi:MULTISPECIES: DUF6417 family protein [unclassified Streptomyces]|uniref:DUF6417 family protein n=1 Tax=unclassified Streptomyces TaxID=2593676 RepID=UPI0038264EF0